MSNQVLDELRQERDQARNAALEIAQGENFDPNDETYTKLVTRAEKLDTQVSNMATLIEQQDAADALDGRLAKVSRAKQEQNESAGGVGGGQRQASLGEMFTRADTFKEYVDLGRGTMPRFEVEARALPTSLADLVSAGYTPDAHRVDTTSPTAPTPLLDNISRVQVSSNLVEYVAWGVVAGGAAVVAEGAAKPSIEFGPDVTSDTLDNIAVYTQLTRQLMEDESAVRSMVDQELVRDVRREEEAQAAAALAGATLPTHQEPVDSDLLAAIRAGIGVVQAAGYAPNAVLLNPADWAAMDNVVMSSTLNGPTVQQNFWGLVPIPSVGQAEGTAIVGDFRSGMTQFFRSQISLYITDSHADTFLSNVFTLLAERRTLAAVVRPQALVSVDVATV